MVFLFATGLAISIGTEIVAIDGDVGRMNTIFKFYEQIWVLFGVAGAVAVMRIKDRLGSISSVGIRGAIGCDLEGHDGRVGVAQVTEIATDDEQRRRSAEVRLDEGHGDAERPFEVGSSGEPERAIDRQLAARRRAERGRHGHGPIP